MAIVTDNYYLSLTQDNRVLRVRCSQGDSSRNINLILYNNGSVFTIPSGVSASVRGVRQNGSVFSQNCSIIQGRTGVVLTLNSAITSVAGIAVAEIVLTDGSGNKVGTSNFIIQVESNPLLSGTVEVGEESPVEYLSDLIDVIDALNARVNNIITPSGDASLSEVVDARLSGYSGTTYQNLKARIDTDIASIDNSKADKSNTYTKTEVDTALAAVTIATDSELETAGAAADAKATGDAISAINESLDENTDVITYLVKGSPIPISNGWVTGKYIRGDGDTVDIANPVNNYTYDYVVLDASEGDVFYVNLNGNDAGLARAYCFIDNHSNVLLVSTGSGRIDEEITAPNGTSKVIFNRSHALNSEFYKQPVFLKNIAKNASDISTLDNEVDEIKSLINGEHIHLTGWVNGKYIDARTNPVDITHPMGAASYKYLIVDVVEGNKFFVHTSGDPAAARAYCFIDENGVPLERSPGSGSGNAFADIVSAPEGAVKLIVNGSKTDNDYVYALTFIDDINDLKENVGDLTELETNVKTDLVSAINEALNSGGQGTTDTTLSISGKPADAAAVGLAISTINTTNAGKVNLPSGNTYGTAGQLLRSTGSGTEWVNYGSPSTEQVAEAVSDWLDENSQTLPTAVEDNSLTEIKFTSGTLKKILNNYVTPEMYGAVGNGSTDDTQALKDMFASGNVIFVFSNKDYRISDSIDVTTECTMIFYNTKLSVRSAQSSLSTFEYMFGIKNKVKTYGRLNLQPYRTVNIGLFIDSGNCSFDEIQVGGARIWGVYTNKNTAGHNGLTFNHIIVGTNGYRVNAKLRYTGVGTYELTDITCGTSFNNWTYEVFNSIFDNRYNNNKLIVDDSAFEDTNLHNRAVMMSPLTQPIVINQNDPTKGTFTTEGLTYKFPDTYHDDEDQTMGRDVFIPVGGGVCFASSASEGTFRIRSLTSQQNALTFYDGFSYGGVIDALMSEYDGLLIYAPLVYCLTIGYLYLEALGRGFNYHYGNHLDKLMAISNYADTDIVFITPFNGAGAIHFYQGNEVIINMQGSSAVKNDSILYSLDKPALKRLNPGNVSRGAVEYTFTEQDARVFTYQTTGGYDSDATIVLDLADVNAYRKNRWAPLEFYTKQLGHSSNSLFKVTLSDGLISEGYTIAGAVSNVLSIDASEYNYCMKITVVLFGNTFHVKAEEFDFVDNTN